ncbi:hypothetical protein DFH06DRAFT_1233594 [Mycena polygramma]|nr:hypothetical protein DFH06DRAFT_1233594 [Mycena polygramma]
MVCIPSLVISFLSSSFRGAHACDHPIIRLSACGGLPPRDGVRVEDRDERKRGIARCLATITKRGRGRWREGTRFDVRSGCRALRLALSS